MSKIALEGNASGTGTLTIASQNTNSNYTLTLPNSTGTLVVTGGAQTIEFAAGTAAAPSITFTGDTNTGIFSPGADTIAFSEGGAEAMRIDSSSNVGIGTSSPDGKLDVAAAMTNGSTGAFTTPHLALTATNTTDTTGFVGMTFATSNSTNYGYSLGALRSTNAEGSLIFKYHQNDAAGTERMRIDSNGNLCVGTTATAGSSRAIISGNTRQLALSDGTYNWYQVIGNNYWSMQSGEGTERARITSGGRFCINTTYSDTQLNIAYNGGAIRGVDINNTISSNQDAIYFRTNGTNVGRINTDASNTSYVTSSDYRLKENVLPMTGALEKLAQLKPCTWTWKVNGAVGQGFIAHELQEVCPNAVVGEKDAIEIQRVEISPAVEATYDEDGNELTPAVEAVYEEREVPKYQGVDTSFLVATLTAAIQELKAELDATKAEVAALKGQ